MFFKIKDAIDDTGYVNVNLVEFARMDLDGAVTLYFINGKPVKLTAANSRELIKFIDSICINVVN